jgi:hypothetical protein
MISSFVFIGIPFAIGGIVTGFLGIKKSKTLGAGKGMSIGGIVMSVLGLLSAVAIVLALSLGSSKTTTSPSFSPIPDVTFPTVPTAPTDTAFPSPSVAETVPTIATETPADSAVPTPDTSIVSAPTSDPSAVDGAFPPPISESDTISVVETSCVVKNGEVVADGKATNLADKPQSIVVAMDDGSGQEVTASGDFEPGETKTWTLTSSAANAKCGQVTGRLSTTGAALFSS